MQLIFNSYMKIETRFFSSHLELFGEIFHFSLIGSFNIVYFEKL